MRQRFAYFRRMLAAEGDTPAARAEAAGVAKELSGNYRARFASKHLESFATVVLTQLDEHGWLRSEPPALLGEPDKAQSSNVGSLPQSILRELQKRIRQRPYSLVTKFLHFTYPNTFPIYDSQAALSIRMWSWCNFPSPTNGNEKWRVFSWDTLSDTSGTGYGYIIDFYQTLWKCASAQQKSELEAVAHEFENQIGGRVTVLDVIDKLLWLASGNPVILGLVE